MNALEARKQLLLAESELNRAQMIGEIEALKHSAGMFAHHAAAWKTIATSATAMAMGGLAAWRHRRPDKSPVSFRRHAIRQGAVLIATLWRGFHSQCRQ